MSHCQYHGYGDSLNVEGWLKHCLTADAVIRFANNPPLEGADAIREAFTAQFAMLQSMKHTIVYFDIVGSTIYQAAQIKYVVKGDSEHKVIDIPGFAVFHMDGDVFTQDSRMSLFEVYLDPSPLHQRFTEVRKLK
ncbi:hypothetical protein FISHEDRAFT_45741 [Fistulina hepatica ATCC 64428]|uniref:SnoaL-like domain-containing protein n=1 Tax=Fistulina hepatica ATCC 64428 TaxID=1128425 RepID=A0A0D7A9Z3_9AGAR|nr:hypothetical protein FISHEDRAFT_45741 [Fistulina hepatica ATCC 64428]